jgi:hypothetical protein
MSAPRTGIGSRHTRQYVIRIQNVGDAYLWHLLHLTCPENWRQPL